MPSPRFRIREGGSGASRAATGVPSPEPGWDAPELVVTDGKWGCWEQDRWRDIGISAVCGGEAGLEPEGTGKWGDGGAAREKQG